MNQRGNILFLILLAIILFVALTYAVNSGMRGSGKDISEEKADLLASQIIQQASNIQQGLMRLKTTGGCKDGEISFANSSTPVSYTNNNAPVDKHCHLFDPAGAGIPIQKPPIEAFDPALSSMSFSGGTISYYGWFLIPRNVYVPRLGLDGGPDGTDLIIMYPYLRESVCSKINQRLGTPQDFITTGNATFDTAVFLGLFSVSNYNTGLPAGGPFHSLCYKTRQGVGGDDNTVYFWTFYHVLQAR